MNIVKVRRQKNQHGLLQVSITIPKQVSSEIKGIDNVDVEYNEETGYVECRPIRPDKKME